MIKKSTYSIDTHVHTKSSDSQSGYTSIIRTAVERGLDAIAITDHGTLSGVSKAKKAARRIDADIEIISGIEINTGIFHIIGLDIYEPIKNHLSIEDTLEEINRQDGLAIIAHPTNGRQKYLSVVSELLPKYILGMECIIVNGGDYSITKNIDAFMFAEENNLTKIGCSDAHRDIVVGLAISQCYGSNFKDFRRAFKSGKVWVGRNKTIF